MTNNLKIYKNYFVLIKDKDLTDFEKEKSIYKYSKLLLKTSFKILLIIFTIIIFFYLLNKVFPFLLDSLFSVLGIIEITVSVLIYHIIRKKINESL